MKMKEGQYSPIQLQLPKYLILQHPGHACFIFEVAGIFEQRIHDLLYVSAYTCMTISMEKIHGKISTKEEPIINTRIYLDTSLPCTEIMLFYCM